jgi:hypothetical protein
MYSADPDPKSVMPQTSTASTPFQVGPAFSLVRDPTPCDHNVRPIDTRRKEPPLTTPTAVWKHVQLVFLREIEEQPSPLVDHHSTEGKPSGWIKRFTKSIRGHAEHACNLGICRFGSSS